MMVEGVTHLALNSMTFSEPVVRRESLAEHAHQMNGTVDAIMSIIFLF